MRKSSVLTSVAMLLLACLVGMPFYYIVVNTFKTQADMALHPLAPPTSFTLDNYADVFRTTPVLRAFLNTIYVTAGSVVLMLLIGSMAAFGMIFQRSRLSTFIGGVLLVAFFVPYQTTIIPLYQLIVDAVIDACREVRR